MFRFSVIIAACWVVVVTATTEDQFTMEPEYLPGAEELLAKRKAKSHPRKPTHEELINLLQPVAEYYDPNAEKKKQQQNEPKEMKKEAKDEDPFQDPELVDDVENPDLNLIEVSSQMQPKKTMLGLEISAHVYSEKAKAGKAPGDGQVTPATIANTKPDTMPLPAGIGQPVNAPPPPPPAMPNDLPQVPYVKPSNSTAKPKGKGKGAPA